MSRAVNRKGASRSRRESSAPRVLPLLKTALFTLSWAVFAGSLCWGVVTLYSNLDKPVQRIAVQGDFKYASRQQISKLVQAELSGGFLSVDLQRIRQRLEQDPWIDSATVSRRWPSQLVIAVTEETPIARWNRHGFLNSRGQALNIKDNSDLGDLPLLLGPQGQAREIMEQYRHAAQMLLPAGLKTMEFRLDQRSAWYLKVANGNAGEQLEIEVGQGDITAKLTRFLVVYDSVLRDRQAEIEHIDIRYPNGVAVSWRKGLSDESSATDRQAKSGEQLLSGDAKHG